MEIFGLDDCKQILSHDDYVTLSATVNSLKNNMTYRIKRVGNFVKLYLYDDDMRRWYIWFKFRCIK